MSAARYVGVPCAKGRVWIGGTVAVSSCWSCTPSSGLVPAVERPFPCAVDVAVSIRRTSLDGSKFMPG